MSDTPIFALNLAALRQTRGLTQGQLALRAGLHPSAVSFYETGTRTPNITNLQALATALQVTTDRLLIGTETNPVEQFINSITSHELEIIHNLLGR